MKKLGIRAIVLILLVTAVPTWLWAFEGFDYSKHSIPVEEIQSGGPEKDGIPSLINPEFITADEATFLEDSDKVIGVSVRGKSKAYPIKILNWHEAVNDTLGGKPIMATW